MKFKLSFSVGGFLALVFALTIFVFYLSGTTVEFQLGRTVKPVFEKGEPLWIIEERSLSSLTPPGREFECSFVGYGESKDSIILRIAFFRRFGIYPMQEHAIRRNSGRYELYD